MILKESSTSRSSHEQETAFQPQLKAVATPLFKLWSTLHASTYIWRRSGPKVLGVSPPVHPLHKFTKLVAPFPTWHQGPYDGFRNAQGNGSINLSVPHRNYERGLLLSIKEVMRIEQKKP